MIKRIFHRYLPATPLIYKKAAHSFGYCQPLYTCFFIFFLYSSIVFSAPPSPHWQQTDYIATSFIDIALNNEYDPRRSKLRKWQKPISYIIDDETIDQPLHQRLVEQHLAHLASITSLAINPASNKSSANLRIIFTSESELANIVKQTQLVKNEQQLQRVLFGTICLGHITINANFEIEQATVIIPIDRARAHGKLLSCVIEELSQTMGLINDSDKVYPSIFNDKSFDTYLSGLDYILLSLLYHPSLKAGMDSHSVNNTVRQLLRSQRFQQKVNHAEFLVRQKSLQNLGN